MAFHPQIDADPDLVRDPAYQFDAITDPDFYSIRIRIQVTQNDADPDADPDLGADPDAQR